MLLLLATAFAQGTDALTDDAAPRERYQAITILDFERVKVDAEIERPGIELTIEPPRPVHIPLIRVRASFDDELAATVDELR
jgi:hypothetical protein